MSNSPNIQIVNQLIQSIQSNQSKESQSIKRNACLESINMKIYTSSCSKTIKNGRSRRSEEANLIRPEVWLSEILASKWRQGSGLVESEAVNPMAGTVFAHKLACTHCGLRGIWKTHIALKKWCTANYSRFLLECLELAGMLERGLHQGTLFVETSQVPWPVKY